MEAQAHQPIILKRINQILSILVIFLGLYLAGSPFVPDIIFFFHHKVVVPYSGKLADFYESNNKPTASQPQDNRLVIPDIAVNEKVLEGSSIEVIHNNGIWRRPASSSDPEKSNMVIVGHRFSYISPYGTFYHLDKIKVGSKMALYWDKVEHVYEVKEMKVVSPETGDIEAATDQPRLTLYTCAPLLTAKDRLVIIAMEIK
jgi:LPXTG-site transpeptidase (sortase) family protein